MTYYRGIIRCREGSFFFKFVGTSHSQVNNLHKLSNNGNEGIILRFGGSEYAKLGLIARVKIKQETPPRNYVITANTSSACTYTYCIEVQT